ncbi:NAD(P)-dependent oxidoreductase [Arenibaculum pallidiluteum]|uniref:NAD(P)-dependent oxidoreductase n=1 Tax=Arenibaculum pallidiluteum TaxID=2812559 RepID=UPI001A96F759|nr:NAD(P)-dependent oxidoreductase [Arenibaculum pallidiluteum]
MAGIEGEGIAGRAIGFVGLGLMGRPMALNLHRAGARVTVASRSPGPVAELASAGLGTATTPREAAHRAEAVILMVTDTPAVAAVLEGPDGVLAGLEPGALVIDMGTTAVPDTRRFAAAVAAAGGRWLDAPVSGGQVGAVEATLSVMVGAEEADFEAALPILRALGRRVTRVGPPGAGQVAKAANQMIVGLTIGAVAEALALAQAAGADPARVREALMGGFAGSRILEVHGQRMVEGSYAPGARATTQLKDMRQAEALAAALGLDLPALAVNRARYEELVARGDGDLDHAALFRLYSARARGAE